MIQDQSQSSFGLAPNVAAGLAALFSWVGGLVILLGKPPQQWVRFVAVQSIVLGIAYVAFFVLLSIVNVVIGLANMWPLYAFTGLLGLLVMIVFFIALIATTIRAFQGSALRLPVLAGIADKYVPVSSSL
ncbi:MAG: hypothetical protein QOJ39_2447 [Candidatus Eremiobacteraeota bacterium]|jgi:uncharacterized membrane protein|nr:hypothetical protein [Candidatus Eremiobacteraeota bacterium]